MRKNINTERIEGYVYQASDLSLKTTGPNAKNPNTPYINGKLEVAIDEDGLNVITVHFTYVTEFYSKSGKQNNTFIALKKIIESPEKTWIVGGKENAFKVRVDASLALNDFVGSDGNIVAEKRNEGSFVTIVHELSNIAERNTFQEDMLITKVNHVEANPERGIIEDYVTLGGAVFNFRNEILPVEFVVRGSAGMKYFEDFNITGANPLYTKVWGNLNSRTTQIERTEETAFGEAVVTTYPRKSKEWTVTHSAKVPYDFGDENILTAEEVNAALQTREMHLAEVKQRAEEYQSSKNDNKAAAAAPKIKDFQF